MTAFKLSLSGGEEFDCPPDRSILEACLIAGIPAPYNCRSGECGECIARLVSGDFVELPGADPAIFDDKQREDGMLLTCLCYPRSDLELAIDLRSETQLPIREVDGTIRSLRHHGPNIVEIVVSPSSPVDYRPGQYFEWILPGITPNRAYSAANPPGGDEIEFHLRLYEGGGVSSLVRKGGLVAGDPIRLRGPYGTFQMTDDEHRPAIMIAGSTGLAPIKAMLGEAFGRGSKRKISFFYGARSHADLYHLDTFLEWESQFPNFSFFPTLSDEPAGSEWSGERGLVTDVAARRIRDAFGAEGFVCGPPPMIDAAITLLKRLDIDPGDIHYDKFSPSVQSVGEI